MLKLSPKNIIKGIVVVIHAPLLLLIYVIRPFIKFRFGYFSVDRIGHFALDLSYAIAINKNKNKNEINLYYLQGDVCNVQLEVIAKRELNVRQYYKYFVYAYIALGLSDKILIPHRHSSGSRDTAGLTYYSKYSIELLDKENIMAESYMEKYGWTKEEKFVCINIRDSAFFNESETSRHICRNSNIDDYEEVVNHLLNLGYWVVRLGKKVEKPFKIKHSRLIDYGVDLNRNDLLDIWFCKNCSFIISTSTGIDSVAIMFKKPIVIVNLVSIIDTFSWANSITAPKRLFWENGKELSLTECLDNHYGTVAQFREKGINIVNLSSSEIKLVVQEMISRLNGTPLTSQQIQNQNKFWNILEHHDLYSRYHGIRNPNASFATSYLKNNPNFLM